MSKLIITVDAKTFDKSMDRAYKKIKNSVSVPGFRKGKVPRKLLEKMYGPEVLYEDAVNFAVPDAYEEVLKECDLEIVSRPEIDVVTVETGKDFVFSAEVATKPEATVENYKGIEVKKREVNVTDEDVDEEIDKVLQQQSRRITVTDREVQDGDIATIDFKGFIDGEAFEGGEGKDYDLKIGSGSFIEGFEEQLIGCLVGQEKDVEVTFPEDYHESSLAGKPALFKVTIKSLACDELPELNDEFADEVSEFDTLAEYKEDVKKNLIEEREKQVKNEKENEAVEKLADLAEVELPEPMVEYNIENMIQDFSYRLRMQGMSIEQYMQMTGMSADKLKEQMRPDAEKRIRVRLALEAVVRAEGIEADEDAIDEEIKEIAGMYGKSAEDYKKDLTEKDLADVKMDVAVKKAAEFIAENAVEVESKEEEE